MFGLFLSFLEKDIDLKDHFFLDLSFFFFSGFSSSADFFSSAAVALAFSSVSFSFSPSFASSVVSLASVAWSPLLPFTTGVASASCKGKSIHY
jgi:hypothetical protein